MSYRINAWLEQAEPELVISSVQTGQVLIHWRGNKIRELIETGQLDTRMLMSTQSNTTDIVKELLLVY